MPASIRRPHAILFDLDDTLWPIAPVIARAETTLHAWLAAHAPKVAARFTIEQLRARRMALLEEQPGLIANLAALRRAGLDEAFAQAGEDAAHIAGAMEHFLAARNAVTLYEDVLPALAWLKRQPGLKLGVITNGNADLAAIGHAHHFELALAAADFGKAKPDPAIFLAACAALGVAPRDAIYVGDDLRLDVDGAQRAGLRAVWLQRHDAGTQAQLAAGVRPDAICADLGELTAWLAPQLAAGSR
ncbi:HAD family hydrolase [Rugamonas sp.]|uniref:HAD family hydrolase n=1 Tax=Rugamonas sp. TaxID=1926287 RepID=UPI0025F0B5DD|nr:HAD family hydrolase [Rugamonas sp.]